MVGRDKQHRGGMALRALLLLSAVAAGQATLRAHEAGDARGLRSFCGIWNDGCNSFRVVPDGAGDKLVLIEPRKTCIWQGVPFCECYPVGSTLQPWCAPEGCRSAWTDGCNDYLVTATGTLAEVLPHKTCIWAGTPACKDSPVTPPPPPTPAPAVTPPPPPAPAPVKTPAPSKQPWSGCGRWYDGCNRWSVNPKTDALTQIPPFKKCSKLEKPRCECFPVGSAAQPWCAPEGCATWFDGCNTFKASTTGTLVEVLPHKTCIAKGDAKCLKATTTSG